MPGLRHSRVDNHLRREPKASDLLEQPHHRAVSPST
jgi:hypothetical protein